MTDQELLALLAAKSPEELTEAEVELLRQRLPESAEVRDALLGQIRVETSLVVALARANTSAQSVLERAGSQRKPPFRAAAIYGLSLALVAAVAIALLIRELVVRQRADRDVAQVKQIAADHARTAKQKGPATATKAQVPAAVPANALASNDASQAPDAAPNDPGGQSTAKEAPAAPPPPPALPTTPWQPVLAIESPPPFAQEAFRTFDVQRQLPRRTDLLSWFEAVPGQNYRITEVDTQQGKCGQLEGLARLLAPWTGDSALKLSLENYNRLQMHFYCGERGVTLVYHEDQDFRWAAYSTSRQPGKARPAELSITSTDDGRCTRTELRLGGPIEIRHRDGELILSRGNIVLLSAPMAAPPEDVYFEGRAAFHGIELIRTQGDPSPLPAPPVAFDSARPGDLPWTSLKPEVAAAQPQPDGSLRFAADKAKERTECVAELPAAGLFEVIVELDDVTPGAGVFLGTKDRSAHNVIRFHRDRRTKQLAVRVRGHDDVHEDGFEDFKERPAPLTGKHCFLRMLYGAGNFRWWISSDGIHWAQVDVAGDGAPPDRRFLGLQFVANCPAAQLTLKRIILRELDGLSALAPKEVRAQAASFPEAASLGEWLTQIAPLCPGDADAADWRRASAIRTLGAGARRDLAYALLELLLDDAAARKLPAAAQLAALNDAMLMALDLRDGQAMRIGLTSRYLKLGLQAYEQEGLPPWSFIQHAAMSVPMVTHLRQAPAVEENLRWELIDSVTRRKPEETLELCRRCRFFQLQRHAPLLEWAEATAQRSAPEAGGETIARLKDGWRPFLVEDVSKETYNAMTEIQSVVEGEAWGDAAEVIAAIPADPASGVAPWLADRDLLVSLPVAVRLLLQGHAPLRKAMDGRFAALARLRLTQATAAGDAAAVEWIAQQFAPTQAAAEAHGWLGDQAFASGWFARAIAEYERAAQRATSLRDEYAPRIRLAAAMLGRETGSPMTGDVRLGQVTFSKDQFESLVTEMRSRGPSSLETVSDSDLPPPELPLPAALQAQVRSRLDGNVGDKPQEEVGRRTNQFRVPWADRQIAAAVDGDVMYVTNRFQVAAYSLPGGQRLWQSPPPPGAMKPAQDWAMIPMRPLITSSRIYVRQLYGAGPQLVCLDKQNGQIVWFVAMNDREFLASDPLLLQGKVVALSIALLEGQEGLLQWNSFDPNTGELTERRDIVRLRNSWGAHACCEVASLEDSLVAVLGGATLAVDPSGRTKWIRKQAVLPADEEPRWLLQRYQRPVAQGERLYVAQPGVRAIECLDTSTGTRLWQAVLPNVQGISGMLEGKLVVWTEDDLRALDVEDGTTLWRHSLSDLVTFPLCGRNRVLYARREPTPGMTAVLQTRFVWVDADSGQELASALVPQLTDADPRLGPLVAHKDRLWTFFGKGQHDPTRDLVEISATGQAQPAQAFVETDAWLRHVPAEVRIAAARELPDWEVLSGLGGERTGLLADAHGEANVVGIRIDRQWPMALARTVTIPPGGKTRLRLRVGNDAGHAWKLEVCFGGQMVQAVDITDQAFPDRWKTLEFDLSELAGQSGALVIRGRFVSGPGNQSATFWKSAELVL